MKKKKRIPLKKEHDSNTGMKASEMILKFASDYIMMGRTLEERQSGFNSACTAWNMSLLPVRERELFLRKYIKEVKLQILRLKKMNALIFGIILSCLYKRKSNCFRMFTKKC